MSKMDDMRAMREARYAAAQPGSRKSAVESEKQPPHRAEKAEGLPDPSPDELCGHRAISGRACTREKGHATKSHRYS